MLLTVDVFNRRTYHVHALDVMPRANIEIYIKSRIFFLFFYMRVYYIYHYYACKCVQSDVRFNFVPRFG